MSHVKSLHHVCLKCRDTNYNALLYTYTIFNAICTHIGSIGLLIKDVNSYDINIDTSVNHIIRAMDINDNK